VAPRGGGTVVIPGSHRLFNRRAVTSGVWRPADVKAALARDHRWLRDLWNGGSDTGRVARFLDEGTVIDGDRFRVHELTGAPGDVILMHSRTLHAPAPNGLSVPRFMLVEIVDRRPSTSDADG
jgi:ectoine hydroxylase-related dioxygenase (phytanoyl-CoA dioxygenase family)